MFAQVTQHMTTTLTLAKKKKKKDLSTSKSGKFHNLFQIHVQHAGCIWKGIRLLQWNENTAKG